jgi:hypothetical protein
MSLSSHPHPSLAAAPSLTALRKPMYITGPGPHSPQQHPSFSQGFVNSPTLDAAREISSMVWAPPLAQKLDLPHPAMSSPSLKKNAAVCSAQ